VGSGFLPAVVDAQVGFDPAPNYAAAGIVAEEAEAPETVESAPTAGSASMANTARGLLRVAREGGLLLLPLAACSFLLFVFAFERAFSLRRSRVIPKPFVRRFVQQLEEGQLDRSEAMQRCRENDSPIAQLFAAAVMKWDKPSVEVEQAIIDAGERISSNLRSYLRLFNGISTISPLLGLLGTVVGMIRAFNTIASADAMGRPDLLASGISQALLTTAAGLVVAIPAIVVHLYFSSRVDRLITEMDSWSQRIVNAIASDGWTEKTARKKRVKAA
jgi:biopolymer transport protein ExbB